MPKYPILNCPVLYETAPLSILQCLIHCQYFDEEIWSVARSVVQSAVLSKISSKMHQERNKCHRVI